ncbi:siderophore-interacting protein [Spirillospora sp. NPDC047418]
MDVGPVSWLRFWCHDPAGSKTESQRGYTISEWDAGVGRLSVDFVLHDPPGPATVLVIGYGVPEVHLAPAA